LVPEAVGCVPWEVFFKGSIFALTLFHAPISLIVIASQAQKTGAPVEILLWGY